MKKNSDNQNYLGLLAILCLAIFVDALDGSIVDISLPYIAQDFNVDIGTVSWVAMIYFLVISSLLLPFSKVIESHGTKNVFVGGYLIFTLSSLICGFSGDIWMLIISRFLQAVGGAMMAAAVPAMVVTRLPVAIRGRAFGIIMSVVGVACMAGPALGGIITHYISWHWIFFINVPVGILGLLSAIRYIPDDEIFRKRGTFDYPGMVLLFVTFVTFLFALTRGSELGWQSMLIIACIITSLVSGIAFIVWENRQKDPVLEVGIFRKASFALTVLSSLMMIMLQGGILFLIPFYLQKVMGMTADVAGFFMLLLPLTMIIGGPLAGFLSDRHGCRIVCSVAAILGIVACLLLVHGVGGGGMPYLVAGMLTFGASTGAFSSACSSRIIEQSPEGKKVTGSAITNLNYYVGMAMGTAVFTLIFQETVSRGLGIGSGLAVAEIPVELYSSGIYLAFSGMVIGSVAVLISSLAVKDVCVAQETE